jgi:hypothetical protein
VCARVSDADAAAAIGDGAVLTNNVHCKWETPDGKQLTLEMTTLTAAGYSSIADYESHYSNDTLVYTKLDSPPDAFFDKGIAGIRFAKGDTFADLEIVLRDQSNDFNPTEDKSAELRALQPLAEKLYAAS